MNILSATYFLNGFLMIAIPVGLTIYMTRKFKQGWRLFLIGAATFIFSQVLHIPFNALVSPLFNQFGFIALPVALQNAILSVFLGLSAGLFEELSRYAMYRWWAKDARSWGMGLLAGAGHGGIEAIILGLLVLYGYIQMLIVRGVDISTLVAPDQVELAKAQIQAYWSAPWYMTMLGALERLFTLPLHLACSVLVLQAFTRKKFWWVGLAILYHALADGVAVFVSQIGFSALAIEGIIGIFAIVSIVIVFALRQPEPSANPVSAPISTAEFKLGPVYETKENLDKTRYQ
ncbi:MAG TPA: YhfC family glutamic-type intramembrane protease [Anaerolineales bacterium]